MDETIKNFICLIVSVVAVMFPIVMLLFYGFTKIMDDRDKKDRKYDKKYSETERYIDTFDVNDASTTIIKTNLEKLDKMPRSNKEKTAVLRLKYYTKFAEKTSNH